MNVYTRRLIILSIAIIAIFLSLYTWPLKDSLLFDGREAEQPHTSTSRYISWHSSHSDNLYDVQNRTLGFQQIRVISLPERTDKHDAWAVAASLSGFDYELSDGVDSSSISEKALPYTMDQTPRIIACWRAHLNVLQDMVKRGVSTTLIFEDDADWDVSLKSQLVQFARGSRWLLNTTTTHRPNSPYGTGWDILWIGHCGGNPVTTDPRRFVIPHDPTVEPISLRDPDHHDHYQTWASASPPDHQTRFVAPMRDAICNAGYAISLEGAKKALYHMSMVPFGEPVDWGYGEMCRDKTLGFNCIAPFPRMIGVYKPKGSGSRWSDIESINEEVREAHTDGLVFSTRMNVDRLIRGEKMMKTNSEVAKLTGQKELNINEIGSAVGHEELIDIVEESD